jgi:hypothetical protein
MPQPTSDIRRQTMNQLSTGTVRKTLPRSNTIMLTVAVMTALIAGAKTAKAWDQHATEVQKTEQLGQGAGRAYGYAVHPQGRSGPYDSVIRGNGVGIPGGQRDFQLEGR